MNNDKEKTVGLYQKYVVKRSDGSSATGGKHEHCRYFVLDLSHDKFARNALEAYAKACAQDYPVLAHDINVFLSLGPQVSRDPTPADSKPVAPAPKIPQHGSDYERLNALVNNGVTVGKNGDTARSLVLGHQRYGSWTDKQKVLAARLVEDITASALAITDLEEAVSMKSGSHKQVDISEDLRRAYDEWGTLTPAQLVLAKRITTELGGQTTFFDNEQF